MLRIFAVAIVLAGILIAAKDHRAFARLDITGSCVTVATATDGSQWRACTAGRVTGKPSLANDGCTDAGPRRSRELWHCPASLAASVTH